MICSRVKWVTASLSAVSATRRIYLFDYVKRGKRLSLAEKAECIHAERFNTTLNLLCQTAMISSIYNSG